MLSFCEDTKMLSKQGSRKKGTGASGDGKFIRDIEAMSNAFYSDKPLSRLVSSTASSRSKSVKGKLPLTQQEDAAASAAFKNHTKVSSDKDKKSSIWSWKSLKALTNVPNRSRRFNCCFSLSVNSIEGLPAILNDACLVVHWKRRDIEQMTRPTRVSRGVAQFDEEQLTHSCSVYGSRSGPHHSAKYEAKLFELYVSVYNAPELDLGKHQIDLTRLFPVKLEELEEPEKGSGKWTTSFRLSGKARGARINVSFGYVVVENNVSDIMNLQQSSERTIELNSVPSEPSFAKFHLAEQVKDLHEVIPMPKLELGDSVSILYKKLDEEISNALVESEVPADSSLSSAIEPDGVELFTPPDAGGDHTCGSDCEMTEFSVVDKGIVESDDQNSKTEDDSLVNAQDQGFRDGVEDADFPNASDVPQNDVQSKNSGQNNDNHGKEMCSMDSLMKELEAALSCTSELVNEVDSQEDETDVINTEKYLDDVESVNRDPRKGKPLILDDFTESVAQDFFEMLGMEGNNSTSISSSSESEPESPRERLLREFEKDVLANGGLLNFGTDYDPTEFDIDFQHSPMIDDFGDVSKIETDDDAVTTNNNNNNNNKTRASIMEDLETESLMREWGINEKAFQHSPSSSDGFESPIDVNPEDFSGSLPPLAEGFGSFVQTKNGGFMRSMNSALFRKAKSGGSLIMQVSNPVVVPAEMGSGVMGILQGLASVGIEKLSKQANKLMPLEDMTGKTIQQIAWEGGVQSLDGPEREDLLPQEPENPRNMSYVPNKSSKSNSSPMSSDPEYVSLEDLAPLAMDKIEALSIEGLRIHSGMSDENGAPSNISAQSMGEFSALKGKTVDAGESIGLDGTCGLQLLDIKENDGKEDANEGLMGLGLSLTLDEWMKLDSGEIDEEELVSERTSKILAAHHATSLDVFRGRSKGEKRRGRSKKYGLLGNNFTVALMVQLRDPQRDYEAVGVPMLALIQVERVFVPPKPRIYGNVSMVRDYSKDDEKENDVGKLKEDEIIHEEEEEAIVIPQYKITEVRVAGLKTEEGKKKLWGSTSQQQSGSRWLLANGMGKKKNDSGKKNPLMKSKALVGKSSGDSLWSITGKRK